MTKVSMPSTDELQTALISALKSHNGVASNSEIYKWVVNNLNLSKVQLEEKRSGNRSEIEYRLAWARTKAKKSNLIRRTNPSTWELVSKN